MNEYTRMKLWVVSFWKPLFKEELINILKNSGADGYFDLLFYCYNKYSDMHPEILSEVFSEYKDGLNRQISVKV